ncbi:hypothetical protein NQ314_005209 [Rhamnusium bicolor]|uniref:DDE Tnp4 domain-containing protein n=1 Tax=Rhamnusium bicolor TaxID=1586634 RepID=A0AAV8ZIW6_9CUCU|nr:hypothetical protein NQ314_005209 [Rhamnusium bicolor]
MLQQKSNGQSAAEQVQEELLEPSTSTVVHQICEKACQTKLIHFRSKYVQANLKSEKKDTAISPIKFQISPRQSVKPPRKRLRLENEKAEFTEFSGATTTETSDSDFFPSGESSKSTKETHRETEEYFAKSEQEDIRNLFIKIVEKNLKMYTGIPKVYIEFIQILQTRTGLEKHYIYITLYKIKTNDSFAKISQLFGISKSRASDIFTKSVFILEPFMKKLIFWPRKISIQIHLPIQFRMTFSRVQSVIDCFEIQIKKPTNALQQSLTWSDYKKCNTIKYLISSTPDGFTKGLA